MKKKYLLFTVLAIVSSLLPGCSSKQSETSTQVSTESEVQSVVDNEQVSEPESETELFSDSNDLDYGVFSEIAGENGTTYEGLFGVILSDEYLDIWKECVAKFVPDDQVDETTEMLMHYINGDKYGEAAAEQLAAGDYSFCCDYINDAELITFSDHTITVKKTDGTEETHTYEYIGKVTIGEGEVYKQGENEFDMSMQVDGYKSTDEAGEFTYFLMREDTMSSTYHLEFRYGEKLEELQQYLTGPYACWLAAGFDVNADKETIYNVIDLFVTENLNK